MSHWLLLGMLSLAASPPTWPPCATWWLCVTARCRSARWTIRRCAATSSCSIRRGWCGRAPAVLDEPWEAVEAPLVQAGRRQRRDRLAAWRRQWAGDIDRDNPALTWLDRERNLVTDPRQPRSYLMAVTLSLAHVRAVTSALCTLGRLVRLGWLEGVEGVETMPGPLR